MRQHGYMGQQLKGHLYEMKTSKTFQKSFQLKNAKPNVEKKIEKKKNLLKHFYEYK